MSYKAVKPSDISRCAEFRGLVLQPSSTVAPADLRSISHRTGETVAKLPLTLRLHSSFTTDSLDLTHRWPARSDILSERRVFPFAL